MTTALIPWYGCSEKLDDGLWPSSIELEQPNGLTANAAHYLVTHPPRRLSLVWNVLISGPQADSSNILQAEVNGQSTQVAQDGFVPGAGEQLAYFTEETRWQVQGEDNRNNVRYLQFQGGYAQVAAAQLHGLLEGYRLGVFRRNEVRVFAGRWEREALHSDSLVTLYRVINCHSQHKGNRRLSHKAIAAAAATLDQHLPRLQRQFEEQVAKKPCSKELKPVARRVLRHIARGGSTTVESLMCFAYFLCRIPQRKPLQRLKKQEHYARFRYADVQAWTGVHRATQSRLLVRLMRRGFLNTVAVHKQNENAYGQLFIDGPMLSLVRRQQTFRRSLANFPKPHRKKRSTPVRDLNKAPPHQKSTLRNKNPKTEIKGGECLIERLQHGAFAKHNNETLRRIALRAAQMEEQFMHQAA